jgi:hypothetical protein
MAQRQKVQDVSEGKGAEQQSTAQANVQPAKTAVQRVTPHYPAWPSSKPGPQTTPVPPGMRPISAIRREQVAEVGYNQETGEPSTQSPFRSQPDARISEHPSFDQAETAQEALHRRKHRIEE